VKKKRGMVAAADCMWQQQVVTDEQVNLSLTKYALSKRRRRRRSGCFTPYNARETIDWKKIVYWRLFGIVFVHDLSSRI
jgi:hypothetical protein